MTVGEAGIGHCHRTLRENRASGSRQCRCCPSDQSPVLPVPCAPDEQSGNVRRGERNRTWRINSTATATIAPIATGRAIIAGRTVTTVSGRAAGNVRRGKHNSAWRVNGATIAPVTTGAGIPPVPPLPAELAEMSDEVSVTPGAQMAPPLPPVPPWSVTAPVPPLPASSCSWWRK